MDHAAPALFQALEASGLGAAIRQSAWLYPFANIGHVVAVVTFFAAVAVMDVRLLGAFSHRRRVSRRCFRSGFGSRWSPAAAPLRISDRRGQQTAPAAAAALTVLSPANELTIRKAFGTASSMRRCR